MIYVHNLSPFIARFQLFGLDVGLRWYGLAYVFGFALAYFWLRAAARRGLVRGLHPGALEALTFAMVLGVLLGGRLGFVLQNLHKIPNDPLFPFRLWEGGMAFFGGLAGVLLAAGWAARRFGLRFWEITDALVFPTALALGIGRIANFINGELVGRPTGGDWGVIFPRVDTLPRHPSQLYEAASHFALFGLLMLAARYSPTRVRGRLSALFLIGYGLLRFGTDFFRADDTYFGPFSSGQWASLLIAAAGAVLLWRRQRMATDAPPVE